MLARYVFGLCMCLVLCHSATVKEGRVVFPRMLEARDGSGEGRVLKITDNLVLNLERSNPYSENFLVRSHIDQDTVQEDYFRAEDYDRFLYNDPNQGASVAVTDHDGLQVEGVLGETLRIHPLPEKERSDEGHVAHLLFHIDAPGASQSDYVLPEKHVMETLTNPVVQERVDVPNRIYPELFLVCDSAFVKHFPEGLQKIVFYFGVMINSVNMRYLSVKNPKVRIRLVGFELNTKGKEPYIQYSTISKDYMIGTTTLTAFRQHYVKNGTWYTKFDMLYLVTGLNIVQQYGNRIQDMAGYAYVGAICTDFRFGVGEDVATTWYHVRTMAHEVGHLLGCPHDGDPAPPQLYHGYGSTQCPWDWGYIMSYIQGSVKEFRFSSCCNQMISHVARMPTRTCMLTDNAHVTYNSQTTLPGKYLNPDKQCQKFMGYLLKKTHSLTDTLGKAANAKCTLHCYASKEIYGYDTYLHMFAIDGTSCTEGKVCYNGLCKNVPNIKPDKLE